MNDGGYEMLETAWEDLDQETKEGFISGKYIIKIYTDETEIGETTLSFK